MAAPHDTTFRNHPQHAHAKERLRIGVVEEVHLLAELVELIDVDAGGSQHRLDEARAQVHRRGAKRGAHVAGGLLEGAGDDVRTQLLPDGAEHASMRGERAEHERHVRRPQTMLNVPVGTRQLGRNVTLPDLLEHHRHSTPPARSLACSYLERFLGNLGSGRLPRMAPCRRCGE